ncbi:MAG: ribbon-helix-helix domain-containing protein [Chloroflexota bacterium]|nr:ribbon-helix-helix domain-containing protein [Chloroflexota bacterium]
METASKTHAVVSDKGRPGKTVAVYLEADQDEQVEQIARQQFTSKSAVVRAAIRLYLLAHGHAPGGKAA